MNSSFFLISYVLFLIFCSSSDFVQWWCTATMLGWSFRRWRAETWHRANTRRNKCPPSPVRRIKIWRRAQSKWIIDWPIALIDRSTYRCILVRGQPFELWRISFARLNRQTFFSTRRFSFWLHVCMCVLVCILIYFLSSNLTFLSFFHFFPFSLSLYPFLFLHPFLSFLFYQIDKISFLYLIKRRQ